MKDVRLDRRALVRGVIAVAIVLLLSFVGSDRLVWFDSALIGYLFGVIFAVFGVVYRYTVWLRRPPTAMLNRRGWDAFRQRKLKNAAAFPSLVATQLVTQGFIRKRSPSRWLAHQLVFWGCILAGLITIPLTLGLLHFESVGQRADRYRVFVFRVSTVSFNAQSVLGWFVFHGLDVAAVLVLGGVFIFLRRRLRDAGALSVERSGDFLALAGLFAVATTGLFLTVSSLWLEGRFSSALNTLHALTVILGLMYLPFGKLFHIFQRPGSLGVSYYKRANAFGPQAVCPSCGAPFASEQQVGDLQMVLAQLGFDYGIDDIENSAGESSAGESVAGERKTEGASYQRRCPSCRRTQVAMAQSARVNGFG
jgi:nitrate reductase gamma subunit